MLQAQAQGIRPQTPVDPTTRIASNHSHPARRRAAATAAAPTTWAGPPQRGSSNCVCRAAHPRPSVFLFGFGGGQQEDEYDYDEEFTVMKLQVGVFGDITKWQRNLTRLSTLYDTDREGGLHAIMMDCLQQLLRNTEFVGYCTSGGRLYDSLEEAEAKFNEVSFEERAKFKEETLVNVDGRTASMQSSNRAAPGSKDLDQWLVITFIIAVERGLKLPKAQSVFDLKAVLKTLGGITVDELLAFELLWTPQDEGESYSKDELLADYPTMVTLS